MTNNKQQTDHIVDTNKMVTAIEWQFEQLWDTSKDKLTWYAISEQAKEMENQQKQITYAEGYAEGYKRGLEIIKWNIENQLKKTNENTN